VQVVRLANICYVNSDKTDMHCDGICSKRTNRVSDRLDSLSALLKARSDAAVLRYLKIGPLLGHGSYGRMYKGAWRNTDQRCSPLSVPGSYQLGCMLHLSLSC
jgi:hypothetical protein